MEECADALIAYFEVELPKLDMSYQWTIPNIKGFAHSGEKSYESNVKLKKYFNQQWNTGVKRWLAFNYISGRNKVTGDATQKRGFAHQTPFKVKSLVANDWQRIKRDNTYQVYLDLLKRCFVHFTEYDMHDLEMVLFANAEKECEKALSINQLS